MRCLQSLAIVAPLISFCASASAQQNENQTLQAMLIGCWENKRFQEQAEAKPAQAMIGSYLVCFRTDRQVTGVTFDAGHGWDWSDDFDIASGTTVLFDSTTWGQVLHIDQNSMLVAMKRGPTKFERLCRTPTENIQCERLNDKLNR
jgi:hypothetical protein